MLHMILMWPRLPAPIQILMEVPRYLVGGGGWTISIHVSCERLAAYTSLSAAVFQKIGRVADANFFMSKYFTFIDDEYRFLQFQTSVLEVQTAWAAIRGNVL